MAWLRQLRNTLRPSRLQRDIDREIAFHVAERADDLRAGGLSDGDATRRARVQFGNPAVQRERIREVDAAAAVEAVFRTLRHAGRTLAHAPGFTVAVIATLTLGIGANAAVFSAIDTVLLQPLPYPEANRLVRVMEVRDGGGETRIAPTRLEDWNRLNTTFHAISGHYTTDVVDTRGELPERVLTASVAPRFFDVLGTPPARGRSFRGTDHRHGGPVVGIMSDRFWHRHGADPRVLDRTIEIQGTTVSTVGIMPPSFAFPGREIDTWSPSTDAPWTQSRALAWFFGIGRLRDGVTVGQAQADLERVQARLAERYPETDAGVGIRIVPLKETVVGGTRASLVLLFGAVSVLLLIACSNIAALLLSRGARRRHEIAVRVALGASRTAVGAQLLTEVALLAAAGAMLGTAVAAVAVRAFAVIAPDLPRVQEIAVGGRILLYTAGTSVVVALLCGLLPALRSARDAHGVAGPARTRVSPRQPLQWLLVGVQVALSVMLLAGAGLLLRSVEALSRAESGFDPHGILTLHVSGAFGSESYTQTVQRINRVLDALVSRPDVETAATASFLPGVPGAHQLEFTVAEARSNAAVRLVAESRIVSPAYFQTMRMPVIAGELCRRPEDAQGRTAEVLVNRLFAERYFQERSVIGLHLAGGLDALASNGHLSAAPPARITGIVADARETGIDADPVPTVYSCFSAPNPAPWFLVRTHGGPAAAAMTIRRAIHELEPRRSVYDIAPLEARLGEAYAETRLRTWLLTVFALTALGLVCAGIYGTLSYAVGLRRREIALRLALGAMRRQVVQQLIGTSLSVVAAGSLCGLVLALLFSQSVVTMLYGVPPWDPATLAGVVALALLVAAVAACVPAARAARVEPMRALRDE